MKVIKTYIAYLALIALIVGVGVSCTQYKNTIVHRGFHNMTSRYNVYFYAVESRKEGIDKLEKAHKDDYTKILPVFIYGDNVSAKEIFPEMDRVIKKSTMCISRHAIKDKRSKQEIIGAVRWIDNAWLEYGKAHFYKREFFPAIETFEYVATTYKGKEKFEAWLWLVKSYNEMNLLSQADPYINLIKNEEKFPKEFKGEFEALHAEFYLKRGMHEEATEHLNKAISLLRNKKVRARYHFILGQLYEEIHDNKNAVMHYDKALKMKPAYDMVFNVKIKHSLLAEHTESNSKKIKAELLAMTKDIKNDEYLDVIYYTLAQIEERDKQEDAAIKHYITSTQKSVNNNNQKARSFLRLGDIYFDKTNYTVSEAYYDSTVSLINENFPEYESVVNRKKSLTTLVGHIRTIQHEDSLQRIASMDSVARNKLIDKIIKQLEEDEQKKLEEKEKQEQAAAIGIENAPGNELTKQVVAGPGPAAWYFYNQQTKTFGINDFFKKWGNNRKLEDNWRRANKQSLLIDATVSDETKDSIGIKKDSSSIHSSSTNVKSRKFYLKSLPFTSALIDTSNNIIIEAYYSLGIIYREQLNNNNKCIEAFETLNKRFPKNKYEASGYYQMYRIYLSDKNQGKAEECKRFLLDNYPNSDYTKIINDPDYTKTLGARKNEVVAYYNSTYELYCENKFSDALKNCTESQSKFGKNDLSPKFSYLKALCVGRTQPIDSLEKALIMVTIKYPKDPVYEPAKAMLDLIQSKKNSGANASPAKKDTLINMNTIPAMQDSFLVNDNSEHLWVIVVPNGKGDVDKLRSGLSDFHTKYFSSSNLETLSIPADFNLLLTVKVFKNKEDALGYYNLVLSKNDVFKAVQLETCSLFVINKDNFAKLIQNKNIEVYKTFFNKHYLGLKK